MQTSTKMNKLAFLLVLVVAVGAVAGADCPCLCPITKPICARDYKEGRRVFTSECHMRCHNRCYNTAYFKVSSGTIC